MTIAIEKRDNASIVALFGEIDLEKAPSVRRALLDCVLGGSDVIVDLKAVEYLDSSGIASLVEAYQAAKRGNLYFALAGIGARPMRVLQLSRLDLVFTIHAGVEDALAARG